MAIKTSADIPLDVDALVEYATTKRALNTGDRQAVVSAELDFEHASNRSAIAWLNVTVRYPLNANEYRDVLDRAITTDKSF